MQNLHVAPLDADRVQVEISRERAEQLARLGLIPDTFLNRSEGIRIVDELTLSQYESFLKKYLAACGLSNSANTVEQKRKAFEKFTSYIRSTGTDRVGEAEVRGFLEYIKDGHLSTNGRWGNRNRDARYTEPVSARTIEYYFVYVQGLFSWAVGQEMMEKDPTRKIDILKPKKPPIIPFTLEQVADLEKAALASHPKLRKRNLAIIRFGFDTGLRADELCNMRLDKLAFDNKGGGGHVTVVGKGDKERHVPFGLSAKTALREHLSSMPPAAGMKVWVTHNGQKAGNNLQSNGLLQLYWKLGEAANITGVRCSPHTMRHTFALQFLRNGGNLPTLQYLLGHARVEQTMRYLRIVEMDADQQHAKYSPADNHNRR